tara:strand:- start:9573 stop:10472 length:900 start_codon:yes stop_codon:yes gene_type:complete
MAQKNSPANSPAPAEELNPDVDLTKDDGGIEDSGDFFESLDREVNGMILDDDTVGEVEEQVTQQTEADPSVDVQPDDHQHDWEKRYKDSSSEAQRLKSQLNEMKEYQPLIERLKNDTGMVNAIKSYVDGGNQPQDVRQALNLPEDFVFDLEDAVSNPASMSAKALEHTIGNVVDHRVNNQLEQDRVQRRDETLKEQRSREAREFKEKNGISDDEYSDMMSWANEHQTTLDDIYYLKNRGERDQKVVKGAKEDMLKQMKSVRSIPASVSNKNTVKTERKHEDEVFDALKDVDSGLDGLFN